MESTQKARLKHRFRRLIHCDLMRCVILGALIFSGSECFSQTQVPLKKPVELPYYEGPPVFWMIDSYPTAKIYPIGWSENGLFAYADYEYVGGGCGSCYTYRFMILDLVTDEVVFKLVAEEVYEEDFDGFWETHQSEISKKAAEFKITPVTGFNFDSGAEFESGGKDYTVEVDLAYTQKTFEWMETVTVEDVISWWSVGLSAAGFGRKTVFDRQEKYPGLLNVAVCGVLKSPFEDRALIFMAEEGRNYEGGGTDGYGLTLIGAHLTYGFK